MKRLMAILAAVTLFAAGCDNKEGGSDPVQEDFVKVSQECLAAGPDGQTFEVTVTSSEDWRISGIPAEWVTLSASEGKSGGKVTIDVERNSGDGVLETEFKIFAGSAVKKISVVSSPTYYLEAESVSDPEIIDYGGGAFEVLFNTNIPTDQLEVEYSESSAEWVSCYTKTKGLRFTKFQFSVGASELFRDRNATVTVSGQGLSLVIPILQNKVPAFFVDTESINVDNKEQAIQFIVRSNSDFSIRADKSWIKSLDNGESHGEELEDGLTRYTCTASLEATKYSREGKIIVERAKPYYMESVIKVSQTNPDAVKVTIADPKFAKWLIEQGWINEATDGSNQYELIEKGFTVSKLTIKNSVDIDEISGLGGFPKLTELAIQKCPIKRLDLSNSNIAAGKFNIGECHELEYVNMGSYPYGFKFASYSVGDETKQWQSAETFTLINPEATYIDLECGERSLKDKEKLKILDVTGCTKLNCLLADRSYGDYCVLEKIYVTQGQMDEYKRYLETGSGFQINKNANTQVMVKP